MFLSEPRATCIQIQIHLYRRNSPTCTYIFVYAVDANSDRTKEHRLLVYSCVKNVRYDHWLAFRHCIRFWVKDNALTNRLCRQYENWRSIRTKFRCLVFLVSLFRISLNFRQERYTDELLYLRFLFCFWEMCEDALWSSLPGKILLRVIYAKSQWRQI